MVMMPAVCQSGTCGYRWQPSAGIRVADGVTNSGFFGVTTECPRCGGPAQFVEGRLNVVDGAIQMISGPQWSWDLIEELRLALRQIVDTEPADPLAELAKINADLARSVQETVEALSKAHPRKSPRKIALKVMAFLAGSIFSGVVGVAIDRATDTPLPEPTTPERIHQEAEHQLQRIRQNKKIPRAPRAQ